MCYLVLAKMVYQSRHTERLFVLLECLFNFQGVTLKESLTQNLNIGGKGDWGGRKDTLHTRRNVLQMLQKILIFVGMYKSPTVKLWQREERGDRERGDILTARADLYIAM